MRLSRRFARDNLLASNQNNNSGSTLDGAQSNFNTAQTEREQSVVITGTTSFVEDAPVRTATMPLTQSVNKMLGSSSTVETELSAFLRKPHQIDNFSWATTDPAQHNYHSSLIGTQLLANSLWANKLSGFRYCRGTAVIRLVLNAQPFQQGRLIVHFMPLITSPANLITRNINLQLTTAQPNVEIDCRDGVGEIEIPYISPSQWFDILETTIDWGTIRVTVLSPLVTGSGGPTTVDCSLWLYFKDFEFSGPMYPQSKVRTIGQSETQGSTTTMLSKVARASTTLMKVPILSSIFKPLAWISDIAADVASIFGFSKPNIDTVSSPIVIRPFRNIANCNGQSQGEPLSLFTDPSVAILSGFAGTDEDEMSFAYLKSREVYHSTDDWATTNATETVLLQYNVGPGHFYTAGTTITGGYTDSWYTYPPFAYISQLFGLWRGGINLHLKFVKTDYHSGRVLVTFIPGPNIATGVSTNDSDYVLREIVDIRETSEVVFKLPYMLQYPYLERDVSSGLVTVSVLTELRAPPTVPSAIQILTYISAAEDYEVQLPISTYGQPFTAQSGLNEETLNVSKWIGDSTTNSPLQQSQFSVGECFTSVKQLLNRYSRVWSIDSNMFLAYGTIWPWSVGVTGPSGTATATSAPYYGDMYSKIASGYVLSRGSMRWLISAQGQSSGPLLSPVYATMGYSTSSSAIIAAGGLDSNLDSNNALPPLSAWTNSATVSFPSVEQGVEIIMPHYNQTPSRINYIDDVQASTKSLTAWTPRTFITTQWDGNTNYKKFFRSMGDDGQLGYFIGFLPILVSHGLTPP